MNFSFKYRLWIFLSWLSLALLGLIFHEAWRDEAQAWLVARSSHHLSELLYRASIEASGPIYYLIIWPFAQIWPDTFPASIQIISFLGTFLAAFWWVFRIQEISKIIRIAGIFSLFFIYEYSAISRLYGWGLFFIFLGFDLKQRGKNIGCQLVYGLALLTQFTIAIAAAILFFSSIYNSNNNFKEILKKAWLFVLIGFISVTHAIWGRGMHPWIKPDYTDSLKLLDSIGNTISSPFLPNYNPTGFLGILAIIFIFMIYDNKKRFIFFIGICLFSYVFLFIYRGYPSPRHAGALFFVWLLLINQNINWKSSKILSLGIATIALFSFTQGVLRIFKEIRFNFSDSQQVAKKIIQTRCDSLELVIFSYDNYKASSVTAQLNTNLWTVDGRVGCPFYEGECKIYSIKSNDQFPDCSTLDCFYIGPKGQSLPSEFSNLNFKEIYSTQETTMSDENFTLSHIPCN